MKKLKVSKKMTYKITVDWYRDFVLLDCINSRLVYLLDKCRLYKKRDLDFSYQIEQIRYLREIRRQIFCILCNLCCYEVLYDWYMIILVSVESPQSYEKSALPRVLFSRQIQINDSLSVPYEKISESLHFLFSSVEHVITFKMLY